MERDVEKAAPSADSVVEAGAPGMTGDEEIEITPEMLQAGGRAFLKENNDTLEESVSYIYREMERARRRAIKVKQTTPTS